MFYVGIGKDARYARAKTRSGRNVYWKRIVQKYGFTVEVFMDKITWEEACALERLLIKQYGRTNLKTGTLCNLTDGGEGILNPSPEVRQKISARLRGRKISEAERIKLSEAKLKGTGNNKAVVCTTLDGEIIEYLGVGDAVRKSGVAIQTIYDSINNKKKRWKSKKKQGMKWSWKETN